MALSSPKGPRGLLDPRLEKEIDAASVFKPTPNLGFPEAQSVGSEPVTHSVSPYKPVRMNTALENKADSSKSSNPGELDNFALYYFFLMKFLTHPLKNFFRILKRTRSPSSMLRSCLPLLSRQSRLPRPSLAFSSERLLVLDFSFSLSVLLMSLALRRPSTSRTVSPLLVPLREFLTTRLLLPMFLSDTPQLRPLALVLRTNRDFLAQALASSRFLNRRVRSPILLME